MQARHSQGELTMEQGPQASWEESGAGLWEGCPPPGARLPTPDQNLSQERTLHQAVSVTGPSLLLAAVAGRRAPAHACEHTSTRHRGGAGSPVSRHPPSSGAGPAPLRKTALNCWRVSEESRIRFIPSYPPYTHTSRLVMDTDGNMG